MLINSVECRYMYMYMFFWREILFYGYFRFEIHAKKYRLVARDVNPEKARKIEFCLKSDIPSKLPKALQDLMKELVKTVLFLFNLGGGGCLIKA